MKIQIAFLLLSFVLVAESAVSLMRLEPCPGHPGRCYSQGPPEIDMKVGETRKVPDQCETISCSKDGNQFILMFTGCGLGVPPPGCEMVEDLSKPHPECCPKVKC